MGPAEIAGLEEVENIPGLTVHIYGKAETRPERKMGHITAIGDTLSEVRARGRIRSHPYNYMKNHSSGIIMGSDSDLSIMQEAAKVLDEFGVPTSLLLSLPTAP